MKYSRKQTQVQSIQYTGENDREIALFVNPGENPSTRKAPIKEIGGMPVQKYDYIIREENSGKCYPMRPEDFHSQFEEYKPGKVVYEFDLNNPDDVMGLNRLAKAQDMASAFFEIYHNLQKDCKWEAEALEGDRDASDGIHLVFQRIADLMDEHGIRVDELIK